MIHTQELGDAFLIGSCVCVQASSSRQRADSAGPHRLNDTAGVLNGGTTLMGRQIEVRAQGLE